LECMLNEVLGNETFPTQLLKVLHKFAESKESSAVIEGIPMVHPGDVKKDVNPGVGCSFSFPSCIVAKDGGIYLRAEVQWSERFDLSLITLSMDVLPYKGKKLRQTLLDAYTVRTFVTNNAAVPEKDSEVVHLRSSGKLESLRKLHEILASAKVQY